MKAFVKIVFILTWLAALIYGSALIISYSKKPGESALKAGHWPVAIDIPLSPEKTTLILLAHPRCPCSKATIAELNKIMAQSPGKIEAHVLFYQPKEFDAAWVHTSLWSDANAIPGVKTWVDLDGLRAKTFGARTSGQTFLYSHHGDLLFSGGITGSRGHEGDNPGEKAVVLLARGDYSPINETPVYGCHLFKEKSFSKKGESSASHHH